MLYSYKWLQELSGTEKSAQEIADLLTVHSFEVESVESQGAGLGDVVIGHVLAVEAHPDADRLRVATVDVGEEKLQIVCGAPNLSEGQKVPVALVGAILPGDFKIKKSKIRGVESRGMICAEDEIGLGGDHDGIMVLAEDAPIGELLTKHLSLDDTIIDIDVLPNRGHDALSHRGMAREIAMLEGRVISFAWDADFDVKTGIKVDVQTPSCTRYAAVTFSGVQVGPSPAWVQKRLAARGQNSINNIVDITNYILSETGQPTHAFSSDFVPQVGVRQAREGEEITLLVGDQEVSLSSEDVVITDGDKAVALAGVMGGKGSAIGEETTDVTLEIAHFDARSVRATKSRYDLLTDAAYHFERDLDPNLVSEALVLAVKLFEDVASAKLESITDFYPESVRVKSWSIALPHAEIVRLLGVEIDHARVRNILERLEIDIKQENDVYLCHVPTLRRDLRTSEDLIEEVGRVYGYDKIHPRPLVGDVHVPRKYEGRYFERSAKDFFVGQGYDEVRSYSYYGKEDATALGLTGSHVTLVNPMSSELAYMRRTLAAGLLRAAAKNQSYAPETFLFEVGRSYDPVESSGLPNERAMLGLCVTSKNDNASQFYTAKGVVESYLMLYGLSDVYFSNESDVGSADALSLHLSRRAYIHLSDGTMCGIIGEVSKRSAKYFGIKNARTAYCEIDMEIVRGASDAESSYDALAKFPPVTRDLSMITAPRTAVADIERVLYDAGGEYIKDVDLFDLYINPKTEERSAAFHLRFQSDAKTLTAEEVDDAVGKMIAAVEEIGGVTVRK